MKKKSDITAKILTLVIAIFLWSYVMSEENPVIVNRYRNVAVTYANTSALDKQGLVIMGPEEVKIDVRVNGQKAEMDKFLSSSIFAQVDLSGYSEGQVKIPITVGILDQTSGITIVSYEPKEVLFTFDRIITKEVPITVTTSGELPENYVLGDILARPQSILLRGPRTWVNEVQSAVAILDISGKTEIMNLSVPVKVVDDSGEEVRGVEKEPGIIDITLQVFKTTLVPIQLMTINELPESMALVDIVISPSEIMIKGDNSVDLIDKIESLPIDVNTLLDKNSAELTLNLPDGVSLLDSGQKVTVTYKVEETVESIQQFSFEQVTFINLEEGLKLEDIQRDLVFTVTLKGYKSGFEDFDIVGMLKPTIDLAGLQAGSHEVGITFEKIPNLGLETMLPGTAVIILMEE
jgi:YbbR domain-containing protein